jgi:hypothetical protein
MGMNLGLNALAQFLSNGWLGVKGQKRRTRQRDDSNANLETLEPRELLTTFTVTTPLDDSTTDTGTSLREAIAAANANPGPDTIQFSSALAGQSIRLSQGELTISDPVSIVGVGATQTIIDAQLTSRVFSLTASAGNVTFDGVTIKGGRTTTSGGTGAGITSQSGGVLTIKNSSINGNATFGVYGQGGGIFSNLGAVVVIDSTIYGNTTSGNYAPGAGIATNFGAITLINATISNNVSSGANSSGAGVATYAGNIRLTNTTVTQNATLGPFASGGGIFSGALSYQQTSTITINNSIVAQNVSNHSTYMDISKNSGVSTLNISNTLVGVGDGTGLAPAGMGSPDDNGNLVGTFTAKLDPKLSPLAYNGGMTKTHALLSNSPAIDMGNNALAITLTGPVLTTDGNGQVRIYHGTVDMGAAELQSAPAVPTVSFTTAAQNVGEGAGTITLTVNLSISTTQAVTIPFTLSGTAVSGTDYTSSTSSILIPAGATSGSIQLTILDTPAVESNESLVVTLGTPTNARLGSTFTETLTIVESHTGAPTSLSLAAQPVAENSPSAVVGTLTSTDPNSNTGMTYSIVPGGQGSSFVIVGNQLKVGSTGLNYEALTGGVATVTVRVTNSIGAFLDKQFTISVKDMNEAPTFAAGQTFTAPTGAGLGSTVGQVIATDQDTTAAFKKLTYSIVSGNTNHAFTIDAVTGRITVASASALNTAGKKYTLQVRVTDGGSPGLSILQTVTIQAVSPFLVKLTGNVGKITTTPGTAVALDAGAALSKVDATADLTATRITIGYASGVSNKDVLSIKPGGGITVNGSSIYWNGVLVAHSQGGLAGTPLKINFTAGSAAAVNAVLGHISLQTTSTSTSTRTLKFLVTAGNYSTTAQMTAKLSS